MPELVGGCLAITKHHRNNMVWHVMIIFYTNLVAYHIHTGQGHAQSSVGITRSVQPNNPLLMYTIISSFKREI
jgi:hypothetical protein